MKALVHVTSGKHIALVADMTKEQLVKQVKDAGLTLSPNQAKKFLDGVATDAMGWKVAEGDVNEEGKFVEAEAEETTSTEEAANASGPSPDSLLAALEQNTDPTLAAVEGKLSGLAAAKTTRTVASGQSGQRLKRIERVTALMATHTELQPMFDLFTKMGMDVPAKLRNIRETGNTVWFDAAGKGEELMIVKKANGYELRHKTVAGGKVIQGPVYNVYSLEDIATHTETIKWLGLSA